MNEERGLAQAVNQAHGALVGGPMADCQKEPSMTIKRHKRLTDLAYRVKDFIDGNGGLDYQESCMFGNIMQNIIGLK